MHIIRIGEAETAEKFSGKNFLENGRFGGEGGIILRWILHTMLRNRGGWNLIRIMSKVGFGICNVEVSVSTTTAIVIQREQ